jgi:trans-aconitate 2-methyltransferase
MDAWNPSQYERFKQERRQPFDDLLASVQARPKMRVVDLGSGTGELTRALHDRLRGANTVGLERSPAMLQASQRFAAHGLSFERADIAEFRADGTYDLVFSNAALQWVSDHPGLFAHLTHALAPTGQLAVQMPANSDHPSQTVAAALAREAPFADALGNFVQESPVLAPERYAELLYRLGFEKQHVRLQVYGHTLASGADVVEWVRGTSLLPYQERLNAPLFEAFLERYRSELSVHVDFDQPYFFAFKRILIWATR